MPRPTKARLLRVVKEARACRVCAADLPLGPRPILRVPPETRLLIIGQAPGTRVHESGVPWDDPSGDHLREWLGLDRDAFYGSNAIGILPMGLCYPGKQSGKKSGGDAPPRPECAPLWHERIRNELGQLERALGDALDLLVPGGRAAVITYHSGEDKIVARRFRDAAADDCVCPPGVGSCRCDGAPSVTLVPRKAITASDDEIDRNPRARSARLRVAEQLGEAV